MSNWIKVAIVLGFVFLVKTKLDRKTKRVLKQGMPEMDEPEIGPVKKFQRQHSPKLDLSESQPGRLKREFVDELRVALSDECPVRTFSIAELEKSNWRDIVGWSKK